MPDRPRDEDDDDFELELEPVDPEILAVERARAKQKTDEASAKVDVDDILREKADEEDYYVDWGVIKKYRFSTRHLLILTAVMAVVLTMFKLLHGCSALFIILCVALGIGWYFVLRAERRRTAERQRIREALARGVGPEAVRAESQIEAPPPRVAPAFSYSLKELLIAMGAAAVMLTVIRIFGVDAMAMTLGIIALLGLVVQAAGFDAPRMVVLGWWLLLVFYLAVGFLAAMRGGP